MKILVSLLCLLPGVAFAQGAPPIWGGDIQPLSTPWGSLEPHINAAPHYYPCQPGNPEFPVINASPNCGSNPPTYVMTPAQCGWDLSTNGARNADGSVSTAGVRIVLPKKADLLAAGYDPSGSNASCAVNVIMPGNDTQYARIGMDDDAGKYTPLGGQAFDMRFGDQIFPLMPSGKITLIENGTSWLAHSGTPDWMEMMGFGQIASAGQGYLFVVTADFAWNTVGSLIGDLAYCPAGGGNGMIDNANDKARMLDHIPYNCIYLPPAASTATNWVVVQQTVSGTVDHIYAGASNGVGGNYIVIQETALVGLQTGNEMCIVNARTNNGSQVNGCWIVKVIAGGVAPCVAGNTCAELHELVTPQSGHGAPSSYVASDDIALPKFPGTWFMTLREMSGGTAHITDTAYSQETTNDSIRSTLVGLVKRTAGAYLDTGSTRLVSSLYNPVQKKSLGVLTADRTVATDANWHEVNSEIRANFTYLSGITSQQAALGNVGKRRVELVANILASNNDNAGACDFAFGIDGTTPTPETQSTVNVAGTNGEKKSITLMGSAATSLTEVAHYVTLLARCPVGTVTVYYQGTGAASGTTLEAIIWQ